MNRSITSGVFRKSLSTNIIMNLVAFLGLIIDSVLISRFLGVEALTGYGLVSPVMMVFVAIAQTVANGNQPLCGEETGRGDLKEANRIFSASALLLGIISGIVILICVIFPRQICLLLGANPSSESFRMATAYLMGYGLGAPGFMGILFFPGILQLDGEGNRISIATVVMLVLDVVLDIANVFVFHGGMFGMGLASSISYYAAIFVMMPHFFDKHSSFRISVKGAAWERLGEVMARGIAQTIYAIFRTLMTIIFNRILLRYGSELYVGAYSVISTIGNCIMSFGFGVGSSTLMVAGIAYGEEDRTGLKDTIREILWNSVILNGVLIILVELGAPFIVDLFLAGKVEVRGLALQGLRYYALFLILFSLNNGFRQYLQGVALVQMANIQSVLENVFISASAFFLAAVVGIERVWLAFLLGHALTFCYFLCSVFVRNRRIQLSLDSCLLVSDDFGIREEDVLEGSFQSMEEVVDFSRKSEAFCKQHGSSRRNAMLIPLFLEEMAGNVIRYGFKDAKRHRMETRIAVKGDTWFVRIKDDCQRFSPEEYMKIHHPEDKLSNIGIRMVYKTAREIKYQNTLRLNNLLIIV